MKDILGWVLIAVLFSAVLWAGWRVAEYSFKDKPAPAKTEQVKVDSLPNITITNLKNGTYLSEAAAITQSSNEPYQIKQEIVVRTTGCLIITDVIDNVDDDEGWENHFSEVVPGTTKAICAEKTRQYKLAAEWIRNIPVHEARERKLQEAWNACEPEGAK